MESGSSFLVGFVLLGLWCTAMFYPVWRKRVLLWSLWGFLYFGFAGMNYPSASDAGRFGITLGWWVYGCWPLYWIYQAVAKHTR